MGGTHEKFFKSCDSYVFGIPHLPHQRNMLEEVKCVRKAASKFKFKAVDRLSKTRVMVMKHALEDTKVVPHLCVYEKCLTDYGDCELPTNQHLVPKETHICISFTSKTTTQ